MHPILEIEGYRKTPEIPTMCESRATARGRPMARMHNRSVARSAARSQRLEVGVDVTAILRPEEAMRLHDLRDIDRVRCSVCREWIAPGSSALTTVSAVLDGDRVAVEFSHAECSPSHADLAALVVLAGAEPLGIQYAQALHPEAGAVLLWERMLDVRVRAGGEGSDEQYLYLDTDWWEGFHPALAHDHLGGARQGG